MSTQKLCYEIRGFDGSEDSCYDLLDYGAMQSGTQQQDFAVL
jgi:hypothetical protein